MTIHKMLAKGMVSGMTLDPNHTTMGQCTSCEYGKAVCKPIGTTHEPNQTANVGDEIHTDVWGPSPVLTPGKCGYYCSFTDNHTHYTCVSLMFAKSETFSVYLDFKSWLKTQHGTLIKCLCSDHGGSICQLSSLNTSPHEGWNGNLPPMIHWSITELPNN